jgi:hypothetical protein
MEESYPFPDFSVVDELDDHVVSLSAGYKASKIVTMLVVNKAHLSRETDD